MKFSDIQITLIDHMGSDLSVVNAARVSFHKESEWEHTRDLDENCDPVPCWLSAKDVKLIKYLANHKHFSPFNHSFITVRVKAPIFVARQLVKHRFMPWNEVSRRYVDEEPEFYFPEYWRAKADNAKQGSSEEEASWIGTNNVERDVQQLLCRYLWMLENGVCPEQARMILPQNMMTEWIWSGTLGAYCDMLRLRLDPHTQYESRIVAQKIHDLILPIFPVSVPALLEVK